MKSLAMLKFNRISPDTDFYSKLDIQSKNILYITHQCDKILKIVKDLENMSKMQSKIEEFYREDETSPQTDSDDKEPD